MYGTIAKYKNKKYVLYAKSNVLNTYTHVYIKKQTKQNTIIKRITISKNKTRHAEKKRDWSKSITQNTKSLKKIYIKYASITV